MTFTRSELEMIYQYAATDRAATVAGLAEIVPVLKDLSLIHISSPRD